MMLDPGLALIFAVTTGAAVLMMVAGVQKRALEWRRRQRLCPSCGRRIQGRNCRAH
jgi:hypothetical protein